MLGEFIGPTLDQIGYDPESYNAGVSAGQDSAAREAAAAAAAQTKTNFNAWVEKNWGGILVGAAGLIVVAIFSKQN